MELIVLNVGLDLGVISLSLFAMLVLMALVTIFSTTPILNLIARVFRFGMEAAVRRETPAMHVLSPE